MNKLLLLIFLHISITSSAQKLQLGLMGGTNISFITEVQELYANTTYDVLPGIDKNFSVLARYKISDQFGLNASLGAYYISHRNKDIYHLLSTKRLPNQVFRKQYFVYSATTLGVDYRIFDNLSVAINLRAMHLPQRGIVLSTKRYTIGNNNYSWDRWVEIYDKTEYSAFDIGIEAGFTYYFWRGLFTDVKYYRGFVEIRDLERVDMYNQVLAWSFGYLFTLRGKKK